MVQHRKAATDRLETKPESVMRIIMIIAMLVVTLTTAFTVTPASACPSGYHRCGSACCPR